MDTAHWTRFGSLPSGFSVTWRLTLMFLSAAGSATMAFRASAGECPESTKADMRILPTAHFWFLFQRNIALRLRIRQRTEVFRKGCLVKASHSGKVVCPVEAKWIFVQDQILFILFSGRRAASEKHMKDYSSRSDRGLADRGVGDAAEGG